MAPAAPRALVRVPGWMDPLGIVNPVLYVAERTVTLVPRLVTSLEQIAGAADSIERLGEVAPVLQDVVLQLDEAQHGLAQLPELVGSLHHIAGAAEAIQQIGSAAVAIARLSDAVPALDELATVIPALQELAASTPAIVTLSEVTTDLNRIAAAAEAIERLAEATDSLPALTDSAGRLPEQLEVLGLCLANLDEAIATLARTITPLQGTAERLGRVVDRLPSRKQKTLTG